ncbi:two-component sensor histidine kinase [Sphingobium lactosutens]|uniref:sensor histidine kinase n=1 Tax=Sphingobium lactosutens TaxID=522773 RepID=UPI0015BE0353|nr:histidine kinase [Sphingobium lactosutens]NWK97030.1 two-component sensor histidine kinase [Sphingobium lactosutens]
MFQLRGLAGKFNLAADPEWLISWGRLIAVLFAALAIYLDPTRPARSLSEVRAVLAVYLLFSLCMACGLLRRPLTHPTHLVAHGIDVLALAILVYLTDELASPFFPFVPFILLATTMRWGMRGAVLGALAMEIMMIAVGWQDLTDGESELNLLIIRSAYFLIAAAMLGYFGACRARSSHRFAQLAGWSAAPADMDRRMWLQDVLDHAARLLGAQRLLLVWRDQERQSSHIVMFGPDGLQARDDLAPAFWQDRTASFKAQLLSPKVEAAEISAIATATGWRQLTIDPHRLRSAPFGGSRNIGRLFMFDAPFQHEDTSALARITALRIGHEIERFDLMKAMEDRARDQERVRLARDLHDSVLQDLTAASLQLKAIGAGLSAKAREPLSGVSSMLAEQQRRIRIFLENNWPADPVSMQLSASLMQTVDLLRDQWGCEIALNVDPAGMEASAALHRELAQLLCEATANAVRHGGATRINVDLFAGPDKIRMDIADNGCGMRPQGGHVSMPRSLRSRVEHLAGSLAIVRHAPGLAMTIEMPVP